MDSSGVRVGDIIDVRRDEVAVPCAFASVAVRRGGETLVVMLTAETENGYRAEVVKKCA